MRKAFCGCQVAFEVRGDYAAEFLSPEAQARLARLGRGEKLEPVPGPNPNKRLAQIRRTVEVKA